MNRIQQLNQTILELRIRGLEARAEIRSLRHINKGQKNALEAAQREIELLKQQCTEEVTLNAVEVICMDARQYESLSVAATGVKL